MFGRRAFIGTLVASGISLLGGFFGRAGRASAALLLRPPGALAGDRFRDACARCFRCGSACPNGCIQYHGLDSGLQDAFTPYIRARERACTLCGECARVCPTGALKPFESTREGWLEGVDMGSARLNQSMCFSYNRRTCGACYQACPLAGVAMKIGVFETPILQGSESCVGCGLCEQACLHLPQAIRVIPRSVNEGLA